jgi:hypothetical protein
MAWSEGPTVVETYEQWKQRRGITEEDERKFKEMAAEQGCGQFGHLWRVVEDDGVPTVVTCQRCPKSWDVGQERRFMRGPSWGL